MLSYQLYLTPLLRSAVQLITFAFASDPMIANPRRRLRDPDTVVAPLPRRDALEAGRGRFVSLPDVLDSPPYTDLNVVFPPHASEYIAVDGSPSNTGACPVYDEL